MLHSGNFLNRPVQLVSEEFTQLLYLNVGEVKPGKRIWTTREAPITSLRTSPWSLKPVEMRGPVIPCNSQADQGTKEELLLSCSMKAEAMGRNLFLVVAA